MRFCVKDLYPEVSIRGDYQASFTQLAVSGEDGGPGTLFLHLEGSYFQDQSRMMRAFICGTRLFVARDFPRILSEQPDVTLVTVPDPMAELTRLAQLYRSLSPATIVGVTGSSGKTTSKDMIAHMLRSRYKKTLKTYLNYNGLLGVALTLRKLSDDDQYAVVEIGLGEEGSVDRAAALAKPHVGVITNIGLSHVGKFGSISQISSEKEAMLRHLPKNGLAVLNGDDPHCLEMARKFSGQVALFGHNPVCDLRISTVRQVSFKELEFVVEHQETEYCCRIPAIGQFQALNAAAAMAVGLFAGLTMEEMQERMLTFRTGNQRLKPYKLGNVLLVDDGYNASPHGMVVSLGAFAQLPWQGRRIAVLGNMQDQGSYSSLYRDQMLHLLQSQTIDQYILIGAQIADMATTLRNSSIAETAEQAALLACEMVQGAGAILLKGTDDKLMAEVRERILGNIEHET